ncbi:MAG: S41 family peptidase, partial [Gammaproteobacteria bacterium]
LLSYLSPLPINWAERARLRVSSEFKDQHSDLVSSTKSDKYTAYLGWLPMEYLNLWQWELLLSSEGDLLETDIDPLIENQDMYFKGNIVVLSNGYCFSACAALLSNLQSHDLATILGESPGSYIGTQYGYPIQVRLPNTGLKLSLPAMEIILHEDVGSTKKLEPNVAIARTKMDVIKNQDIVLKKALEIIREKQ